ncbi:MAG: Bro-N domain-containing protein [Patescibacteria group bacterium]
MDNDLSQNKHIAVFRGKTIRKTIHKNEWWFSVIDVIEVLTGTERPRKYWSDLKKKLLNEGFIEVSEKIGQLKLHAPDGKLRETDCTDTETMFRLIQSIPSPSAEPFKRWLAKVGYERIQEIEDPELAAKRTRTIYKAKGYTDAWIEKRMRGIEIRETLTNEWRNRGVKEDLEYAILTAEISKATFGMTPSEYQKFKGLNKENLRDHMNDLELIFSMLGEASTTKIAKDRDAKGFKDNKSAAQKGGRIAGDARLKLELESGGKVVSEENYLTEPQNRKRIDPKASFIPNS